MCVCSKGQIISEQKCGVLNFPKIVSIILRKLSIDKPFTELVVTKILTWKPKITIFQMKETILLYRLYFAF